MKQIPLAKEYFGEMIRHYPDHDKTGQASMYMGHIYYQGGEMKEAVDFYKRSTKAKDTSLAAEARYRLAESLYSMGDSERAILAYQAVISEHPDQPLWVQMARFRLGNIYEQEGKKELALDFYAQTTQMKEGTPNITQAAQERIQSIKSQNMHEMDKDEKNG